MSRASPIPVPCPGCGQTQEISVWSSVNVTVDPHLKEELLARRLNVLRCPCGREAELAHDLLYHDMDRAFQVWLKYPDDSGQVTLDGTALRLATSVMKDYTFRVVRNWNELVEKILIFDDRLDDRIIEVIKLTLLARASAPDDSLGEVRYVGLEGEPERGGTLGFVLFEGATEATPFEVPVREGYQDLRCRLETGWPEQMEESTSWRIIDRTFATGMAQRIIEADRRRS